MNDPIIVSALFPDDERPPADSPPPPQNTGFIPTDDDIGKLGAGSRETYAAVTAKLLESHKSSDLGEMAGKLNELITVAKGIDGSTGKGLFERAMGFIHSERERILIHMQSVQGRLDALQSQIPAMLAAEEDHVRTLL